MSFSEFPSWTRWAHAHCSAYIPNSWDFPHATSTFPPLLVMNLPHLLFGFKWVRPGQRDIWPHRSEHIFANKNVSMKRIYCAPPSTFALLTPLKSYVHLLQLKSLPIVSIILTNRLCAVIQFAGAQSLWAWAFFYLPSWTQTPAFGSSGVNSAKLAGSQNTRSWAHRASTYQYTPSYCFESASVYRLSHVIVLPLSIIEFLW